MNFRRALGALFMILTLAPLPALCTVCSTGPCPVRAAMDRSATAQSAMDRDAPQEPCHMSAGAPAGDCRLNAAAPDCCVRTAAAAATGTPAGVLAQELASLALAPLAPAGLTSPAPGLSFEAREGDPPPFETRVPLYTLHSSLLI